MRRLRNPFVLRNPLAPPSGRLPRLNPNHIAFSHGLVQKLCAVFAQQSQRGSVAAFTDIATGLVAGANGTSPQVTWSTAFGGLVLPVQYPYPVVTLNCSGRDATNFGEVTFAGLFYFNNNNPTQALFGGSTNSHGFQVYVSGTPTLGAGWYGLTTVDSGLPITGGHNYFVIVSTSNVTNTINFLTMDLATGLVRTYTHANPAVDSTAPNGTYVIGTDPSGAGNHCLNGSVYAVAYLQGYIGLPVMEAWAQDGPFDFWHPPSEVEKMFLVGVSLVTATGEADGAASVSGAGIEAKIAAGEADGAASVSGIAASTGTATGEADGAASVSGAGVEAKIAAGEADGSASVSGSGVEAEIGAGEADGSASVSGAGIATEFVTATGEADGSASVSGSGVEAEIATGEADGAARVSGAGAWIYSPDVFPTLPGIGWPVHRRPTFRTLVAKHPNGGDVRTPLWTYPLWEFELTFEGLSASLTQFPGLVTYSMQSLMGFFLYKGGAQTAFLFIDPDFNADTAVPLGTGDGTTTQFLFLRRMGSSIEPVSWVTGIPTVYLNGVAQPESGWAFEQPNLLVFSTPPAAGVPVTADVSYGFLCRFLDDQADFEQLMWNLWEAKSIKFRQVRTT